MKEIAQNYYDFQLVLERASAQYSYCGKRYDYYLPFVNKNNKKQSDKDLHFIPFIKNEKIAPLKIEYCKIVEATKRIHREDGGQETYGFRRSPTKIARSFETP